MSLLHVESFHTVLFCRKWDACVAFYRDILEFEIVDTKPGFVEFQVTPGSRIGLIRHSKEDNAINCDASCILSFRVPDIDRTHEILSARCNEATEVRHHPWGARLFELRDPEGRRLEFWIPQ
jgi:catechol 2,3-dioxygenase-like lactoylglutathione lyase family enzyme